MMNLWDSLPPYASATDLEFIMTEFCNAIVATAPGGPDVLKLAQVPMPVPGPGELLVKIAAVGVNFIESYQRDGTYTVPFPFTPEPRPQEKWWLLGPA